MSCWPISVTLLSDDQQYFQSTVDGAVVWAIRRRGSSRQTSGIFQVIGTVAARTGFMPTTYAICFVICLAIQQWNIFAYGIVCYNLYWKKTTVYVSSGHPVIETTCIGRCRSTKSVFGSGSQDFWSSPFDTTVNSERTGSCPSTPEITLELAHLKSSLTAIAGSQSGFCSHRTNYLKLAGTAEE